MKEIGFEGILHIKITNSEGPLMKYLIENFDVYRCVVRLGEHELLFIEEDDVERTLGIPQGKKEVEEATKYEDRREDSVASEYTNLLNIWR